MKAFRRYSRGNMNDELLLVLDEEARRVDEQSVWPERSIQTLAKAGSLAPGATMRQVAESLEKIAARCASTAMIYLMHVCGSQVIAASTSPRRAEVLKRIAEGKAITTLAFSEKGSRSHFWAPVSRASRNSGGAILNCDKSFVTSANRADYYVVSSGAIGGSTAVDSTLYLVEKNSGGVEWPSSWNGTGLRGNASAPMTIRNCHVDASARLTNEGEGFKAMMEIVLPWFQIGSAAVSIGIAEAAFGATVAHTTTARFDHLGETLASALPTIRARLARMRLAIDSARGYLDQTLKRIETGAPDAMLFVLGSKATAAEMALTVTDEAMRACGGAAYSKAVSVERNFRDARAASIMAPTTDVLYDFIGKAVTGLPLF
jgi:alkylation response protein AidB-like acyl-CoA dehydrogenase